MYDVPKCTSPRHKKMTVKRNVLCDMRPSVEQRTRRSSQIAVGLGLRAPSGFASILLHSSSPSGPFSALLAYLGSLLYINSIGRARCNCLASRYAISAIDSWSLPASCFTYPSSLLKQHWDIQSEQRCTVLEEIRNSSPVFGQCFGLSLR